jgi:4a-hydroxytetrahydrobiopterin dehydratase
MSDLANKKCVPCEGNIPPFNLEEIHKYLKKVDGWEVLEDKIDGYHLIKNFKIFTHAIKGLAESDFILAAKIDQISSV